MGDARGTHEATPRRIALDYAFNRCKSCAVCMFIALGASDKKAIGRRNEIKCYFLEILMRKHQLVCNCNLRYLMHSV